MKKHLLFSRVNHDGRTTVERRSNDGQSKGRYSVGLAKLLFTITLLLTLGVGQMWANYSKFRGNIYYNNSSSNWSYVSLVVGKDDYSCAYLFSHLNHTKLYYKWIDYSDWNDCYFFNENWGSSNCESNKPWNRISGKTYWQPYKQNYDTGDRLYFNGTDASSAAGDLPLYTATLKVRKSTDGGSYTTISSGSWPATINLKGTIMDGNSSTKQTNFDTSSGSSATYKSIPVTGEVTLTLGASADAKYEFAGWSTSSSGPSSTTTPKTYNITGATTYYAFFRTKEYTVSYNGGANATGGSHANDTKYHGTSLTLPGATFTRTGYTQTGWATSDGGAQAYALSASYTSNAAVTLYPVWTATDYTITYNNMTGATNHASNPSSYTINSSAITLQTPTKVGYMFDGWYTDEGLNTPVSTPAIAAGSTGNKVFYAKWTEITISATVSPTTGATGASKDFTFSITSNVPTDGGYYVAVYTFGGVDAGVHGGGYLNGDLAYTSSPTSYTASNISGFSTAGVYTTNAVVIKDAAIQATSSAIEYAAGDYYTVSFNMQGHGDAIANQMIASGSKATEPSPAPTAIGYTFGGWYKEETCTNAWNFSTETVTANRTLFAKWTANQYTITFDKEGGSGGSDNVTVYYDATLGAFASAPTRTGYTFAGYWTGDDGTGTMLFAANGAPQASVGSYTDGTVKWIYAGNPTVYAKWTENTVTVSPTNHYDAGNPGYSAPTASNSGTVGIVSTSQLVAPAPGTGYTFAGWTLSSNLVVTIGNAATDRTITVRTNGDGNAVSATANYNEVLTTNWKVIGDNQSGSPFGDNYAYASGKAMSKKTGHATEANAYKTIDVTKLPGSYYGFKVATAAGNSNAWGYGESDGYYITFNRSASGTQKQVYNGNQHELKFVPDALGEYEFRVNYPGNKYVYVTFPTAYTVTFGMGTGGNTVTAKYSNTSFDSGTKVQSGKTVRFTQTEATGYQFKEWNTKSNGSGEQLSTNSSYYDRTVASTNNVYAIYDPKQYTITLNDQDATTAVSPSTVNATYKSLTLSSAITNPLKTGYTFGGWYSAVGGGGSLIINTSGALQASKSGYTDATGWTKTSAAELYAKWTQVLVLDKNGGTTDGGLTVVYKKTATSSHTAATRTGYTLAGYYDDPSGGNKIINADGTLVGYSGAVSSYISSSGAWIFNGTPTLYAHWTANTYQVHFNGNGNTGGSMSNETGFTYDEAKALTANTFTKTGYDFAGWATSASGAVVYSDGESVSNLTSEKNGTAQLYAKWTAKSYTVELDIDEDNHGTIAGKDTEASVTYDAAPSSIAAAKLPTAANGYCFMGFFTASGGSGVKIINADGTWVANETGYMSSGNWVYADNTTLYAYYKKAEITGLTVSPVTADLGASVTATVSVSPEPTGTTVICWKLLRSNGTEVGEQPTFSPENARSVSFNVPTSSGTYKVVATLRLNTCGGTLLDSDTTNVIVAGVHTVTIQYKCGSDVLQAATSVEATPLDWTDVSAPTIFGYRFTSWTAGDGITLQSSTSTNPNKIKASYGGTLTANYAKNDYIYFKNTLGWGNNNVYVYFYKDGGYFDNDKGAGATGDACIGKGKMSLVEGETDILYWDYGKYITGGAAATKYIAFTHGDGTGHTNFNGMDVVYPINGNVGDQGFNSGTPMFVPLAKTVQPNPNYRKNGSTPYFDRGYWTKYLAGTGYSIDVFYSNGTYDKSVAFEGDGTHNMPYTATVNLTGGSTLGIKIHRSSRIYYYSTENINMTNASTAKDLTFDSGATHQTSIQTNAAGDYVFTLTCAASGELQLSVKYPAAANDYRIVYNDRVAWSGSAHSASWLHPSDVIHKNTSATDPKTDIVSFYVSKAPTANASMKFQYISTITNSSITWTDVTDGSINLNDISESGVYNFYLSQPAGGASIRVDSIKPYTGDYYIRSSMANSKWDNYTTDHSHLMNYSDYSELNRGYSHYWVKFVSVNSDIRYVIANDYSPCISDTLVSEASQPITINGEGKMTAPNTGVNIRSMWNQSTNKLSRAFLTGPVSNAYLLLRSEYQSTAANNRLFKSWTSPESNVRLNHASFSEGGNSYNLDTLLFTDKENWIYELDIYARPAATYKLSALVNGTTTFFRGEAGNYTTAANVDTVIGGDPSSTTAYHVHMVYDFKTDRMVKAWMPTGAIEGNLPINADIMIVREHQGEGQQITFNNGSLSKVHTAYGVMRFNRWTLNNKSTAAGHAALPVGDQASNYERGLYWISFPFDVNLSDVFGFGTYGVDWIIEYYDGEERAEKGFWADSEGFWKYVMPSQRSTYALEAGKGYVLALDLDRMKDNNTDFWKNNIEEVELFFPSATEVDNISLANVKTTVHEHACTHDRTGNNGSDINKNRTRADSHWNIIGVPSYANYGSTLTSDGSSSTITWNSNPYTNDLPFLYEWEWQDDSYIVQPGSTYPFKSMHAYMVQYHGDIYWSLASATPQSIVARRTYAEKPQNAEFRMELQQNGKRADQTIVKLSDDEKVSADFAFDEDLCKEFNANKANIYTIVENYIPTAGNTLPMSEQTTVIPVGVKIAADGDYTFAVPDGTNGVGVTLIDTETGVRTSLSALDYTINLSAGTYDSRFVMEISPIQQISTDIENSEISNQNSDVRKVMIDQILYIIKDGVMYDARGARVQ